jgi:hypothetical protein
MANKEKGLKLNRQTCSVLRSSKQAVGQLFRMNQEYRIVLLLAAVILPLLLFRTVGQDNAPKQEPPPANTLYDPDPNHLWNRLYAALFVRMGPDGTQYGTDSPDPYLWHNTKFLLEGDSRKRAIAVLDEFLDHHGEDLIHDPVKRAFLQHDLWAVFDWAGSIPAGAGATAGQHYRPHAADLTVRLAKAIRRLALTGEQIQALPDNYAAAVASKKFPSAFNPDAPDTPLLPADLWQKDGPWVCIKINDNLPAPRHTQGQPQFLLRGGNAFLVFVNLPGGRQATLDYLSKISQFSRPVAANAGPNTPQPIQPNPNMLQFPKGTAFALASRMLLIDDKGDMVASPITMSVQMRVYPNFIGAFYEFKVQRGKLFASDSGGFHSVDKNEKDIVGFIYDDIFQAGWSGNAPKALNCTGCHFNSNFKNALSLSQFMNPSPVAQAVFTDTDPGHIFSYTIKWKNEQYTWGLLKGLWQSEK